jgi:photosystem II stability/assembly factor-like uncharacterized protein
LRQQAIPANPSVPSLMWQNLPAHWTKLIGVLAALIAYFAPTCRAQWEDQESGTKVRLRGLSVVNSRIAWASGAQGTVLRTIDGGQNWLPRIVPGSSELDFRDVHAISDTSAYLLSIGPGELSRIYKTTDAGATWNLSFKNKDPRGFLDAIAFWNDSSGLAQGDPVDGQFVVIFTDDAGKTWKSIDASGMPRALPGEGGFAASGTSLAIAGDQSAWFGTGGAASARVFRSTDRGKTWTVHGTPVQAGSPSSGIFSLAFRDPRHGVAVGGDHKQPERGGQIVARTIDGGLTWLSPKGEGPRGFRSSVAYVPNSRSPVLVAVGPSGSDVSTDDGDSWKPLGSQGFHAVSFGPAHAGWAVGEDGIIGRFNPRDFTPYRK